MYAIRSYYVSQGVAHAPRELRAAVQLEDPLVLLERDVVLALLVIV